MSKVKNKDHNRPNSWGCPRGWPFFLLSQKFTLQDKVMYHQVIHHFGNSSYFIIHLRHNFSLILGLILLKLKHASDRPVNPSCLQSNTKKLLPYHISTLNSKIQYTTWYYNSQRQKIPQNPFPAKNLLKQTTYLLLEAKTSSYFIACVKTRNSIMSNYHVLQVNTAHFDFRSTGIRLLSKSITRRFWDSRCWFFTACLVYPTDFPLLSSIRVYFV